MSIFNFESQICTSREQSERLLALGLKKETADMIYVEVHCTDGSVEWDASPIMEGLTALDFEDNWPPAWSLHRLIDMCYVGVRIFEKSVSLSVGKDFYAEETLYDNLINCIEWLIKAGYFNKEYLV